VSQATVSQKNVLLLSRPHLGGNWGHQLNARVTIFTKNSQIAISVHVQQKSDKKCTNCSKTATISTILHEIDVDEKKTALKDLGLEVEIPLLLLMCNNKMFLKN